MNPQTLSWLADAYVILRMPPGQPAPDGIGVFLAVLHEAGETTVVGPAGMLSATEAIERSGPWRAMHLAGPLPHDAVGLLARLSGVLASRSIPIFALSTFDTDYVLVPSGRAADADAALREAGYILGNTP